MFILIAGGWLAPDTEAEMALSKHGCVQSTATTFLIDTEYRKMFIVQKQRGEKILKSKAAWYESQENKWDAKRPLSSGTSILSPL